jgi:hypothetical protein
MSATITLPADLEYTLAKQAAALGGNVEQFAVLAIVSATETNQTEKCETEK